MRAIRPTSINIKPIDIKDKLTNDQYRLYVYLGTVCRKSDDKCGI